MQSDPSKVPERAKMHGTWASWKNSEVSAVMLLFWELDPWSCENYTRELLWQGAVQVQGSGLHIQGGPGPWRSVMTKLAVMSEDWTPAIYRVLQPGMASLHLFAVSLLKRERSDCLLFPGSIWELCDSCCVLLLMWAAVSSPATRGCRFAQA